tara:strand:- start:46 stop:696 length:651 start_codon:yes stop_codon:yes gene_type:complete
MEIIKNSSIDKLVDDMRHDFIDETIENIITNLDEFNEEVETKLKSEIKKFLNINIDPKSVIKKKNFVLDDLKENIRGDSDNLVNKKRVEYGNEIFTMAQKSLLLQTIDKSWRDHLLSLDHLRQGISLRAYGQRDPLNEYQQEAFIMFEEMTQQIRTTISQIISHLEIRTDVEMPKTSSSNLVTKNKNNLKNQRVARNAKCPCGSGKKFKNCCGKLN